MFDSGYIPDSVLHRRAAATSLSDVAAPSKTDAGSDTTSTDTTQGSDTAVATSRLSEPTDTASLLPKPFNGGLGTNYTQPSCRIRSSKL